MKSPWAQLTPRANCVAKESKYEYPPGLIRSSKANCVALGLLDYVLARDEAFMPLSPQMCDTYVLQLYGRTEIRKSLT